MSQRPTIHQVSGGWCRVCGELEDWLRDQGEVVETAAPLRVGGGDDDSDTPKEVSA